MLFRSHKKLRRPKYARQLARSYAGKTIVVVAPEKFDIAVDEFRPPLIFFLHRIKYLLMNGANVRISFEKTTNLLPAGTLLLVATLESLLEVYPNRISSNYPSDHVVEQLFQHIGLLQKLGNGPRRVITADNVRHWHLIRGTTADVSEFKNLFSTFESQLGHDTEAGLFESMSEAVTNTVQHAYPKIKGEIDSIESRWWMFAQQKDDKLDVTICDLGVGIPKSLTYKRELAEILPALIRRLRKRADSGLIEVAVESSRSRTKLPHRGKGLPDMLAFIRRVNEGGFLICSLRGQLIYNAKFRRETARDFADSVPGTLIQWNLPLLNVK